MRINRRPVREFDHLIKRAIKKVSEEISGNSQHSRIAAGMAAEGYTGGYRDALRDVLMLTMADVPLPTTRGYWTSEEPL